MLNHDKIIRVWGCFTAWWCVKNLLLKYPANRVDKNLVDLLYGMIYVILFVRFMIKIYRETTLEQSSEKQVFTPWKKNAVSEEDQLLTSLVFKGKQMKMKMFPRKDTQIAFSTKFKLKKLAISCRNTVGQFWRQQQRQSNLVEILALLWRAKQLLKMWNLQRSKRTTC